MILTELQKLEQQIKNGEWEVEKRQRLWSGADVIVCSELTEELDKWKTENRAVIGFGMSQDFGRQVVVSKYAAEISTLFHHLSKLFESYIDYANKYDFYGRLAYAANRQIEIADNMETAYAIMEAAKKMAVTLEGRPYFAYGSNMDEQQMRGRCRSAQLRGSAILSGHRFVINCRGVASVVPDGSSNVVGLLWMISPSDEAALDRYEGVEDGYYTKNELDVSEITSSQEVESLIYIAAENAIGKPRPGYLEKIVNAAQQHGFSQEYINFLRSCDRHDR